MKLPIWRKTKDQFNFSVREGFYFRSGRLWFLIAIIICLYLFLLGNFYKLQIKEGGERAALRQRFAAYIAPPRGNIYFKDKHNNHIPAAINKTYPVIFAVPKEIEDPAEAAEQLAETLNLDASRIKNSLSKSDDLYEVVVKKADPDQVIAVKKLGLKGVYVDEAGYRFYPFTALASQLIGFVGAGADDSEVGRYGIESFYESMLSGRRAQEKDGKIIRSIPGSDVFLTIDRNIQARAEEILAGVAKNYDAERGTVIVQNPRTGEILALANYPNFDPNNFSKYPLGVFLNHATSALYEPGSILKVITMAAGLDAGKITPQTRFYDSGLLTLNGKTIRNWDLKSHGSVTMTEIIEQSINTGAAHAEKLLGHNQFYKYLVNFGLNEKTGIDLPGELGGNLRNLEKNAQDINFATASYGQGISLTPIELINAFSAIANGGLLMRPYVTSDKSPSVVHRVISSEAAKAATAMMVSAVDKAEVARIPSYAVAGKTGTAQVPDFKKGGYTSEVINTYVGYAPASDPRFVILIKLDKPKGAPLAGETVVPAFRELAEFILNYYNVPPDRKS
jgi:cell division protein FtsI/penicillin-binding protein 2